MNHGYLDVGVPDTTQESMAEEEDDHPVEPSETLTLAGPEAPATPELSAPKLVGPSPLSIAKYLTSWSKGMEISHHAHRNARFCCRSCIGPSHF